MEAVLANEIKAFRKQFRKDHGRDPSRKDMAKNPEMRAAYETWLAIKSTTSDVGASSSSSSKASLSEGKQSVRGADPELLDKMLPPPTTPKKKRRTADSVTASLRSPSPAEAQDTEMLSAVHDSGGSIVDVPTTPKQTQRDSMADDLTPSQHRRYADDFEDGTSPSKLRTLIASFAATRSRLTPTKMFDNKDDDEQLRRDLRRSRQSQDSMQSNHSFTPRTKARKRLRGEVVVTPVKSKTNGTADRGTALTNTVERSVRPTKRQRGTGTLRAFGFTAASQKQSLAKDGGKPDRRPHEGAMGEDNDSDEDDELIGPSPSTQRVVNMPIGPFRPLFTQEGGTYGGRADGSDGDDDDEEEEEGYVPLGSSQTAAIDQTETAVTTPPAKQEQEEGLDSDQEERRFIRQYQRYDLSAIDSDAEEEEFRFGGGAVFNTRSYQNRTEPQSTSDHATKQEELSIGQLTLQSPQGKRAKRYRRRMQAENVRRLLDMNDTGSQDEDVVEANDEELNVDFDKTKSNQQTIAHGNAKTARMMRGTLTKTARKKLAIAEEAERENLPSASSVDIEPAMKMQRQRKRLILRRGREDEEDDEVDSQQDHGIDPFEERSGAGSFSDNDEWASDVDSAEYGLGDGYMDEVDVI